MRILIVEDEVSLAEAVAQHLKRERYQTDMVHDGNEGYACAAGAIYDLIILDIMLPGMNGLTVLKRLRGEGVTTPVLLLTAKSEVNDRVTGLDAGADDYLPKPFATRELLARVRALTRRRDQALLSDTLEFGDLRLNTATLSLSCGTRDVVLTAREFEILQYLLLRKGTVTSKEQIIDKVWGYDGDAEVNNVEVYISLLRKKFRFLASEAGIKTIRNLGYSLEA